MKYVWVFLCAVVALFGCDKPVDGGPPVAVVPENPWFAAGATSQGAEVFASCASCHMADGSGRSDGQVPRLAGQRAAILVHKLEKLQAGTVDLPVMVPFARALSPGEVSTVSQYLAGLPVPAGRQAVSAATDYGMYCAACHGDAGQGNDALLAPRLCGQHAAYVVRRVKEIRQNERGDADPAMQAILAAVNEEQVAQIATWLSAGTCSKETQP